MAVVKFLRKFFAVIFAFVFGIFLLLLIFIIFAKGILNETSIDKYVGSEDIFGIEQSEILQSNNNNTFGTQISYDLLELGISEDITSNILKSDGLDRIISEYVYDYVHYVLFYEEMPVLSSEEIIKVIDSEGLKLISGEISNEQDMIINNYIVDLVDKINNEVPANQELINMGYDVDLVKMICSISFSVQAFVLIIVCLVLMILLVGLCLYNLSKTIRTISIPILLVGIILVIGSMIEVKVMNMLVNGEGIVETIILKIVNESFKDLFVYGLALLVVGIIFLVIAIILGRNSSNKKSNGALPIKEKRNQVKEQLKDHIALSDDDIDKIDNTLVNKQKEIVEVKLPSGKIEEKQEEVNVDNQNEIPKVDIISEIVNESMEEVKPILLEEKSYDDEEIVNSSEIVQVEDIENRKEDEIKVIEVEKLEEQSTTLVEEKQENSYFEIDDIKEDNIIKRDIDIKPLENIDIKVTSPVKGKDIKVDLEKSEEQEEDIELL